MACADAAVQRPDRRRTRRARAPAAAPMDTALPTIAECWSPRVIRRTRAAQDFRLHASGSRSSQPNPRTEPDEQHTASRARQRSAAGGSQSLVLRTLLGRRELRGVAGRRTLPRGESSVASSAIVRGHPAPGFANPLARRPVSGRHARNRAAGGPATGGKGWPRWPRASIVIPDAQ